MEGVISVAYFTKQKVESTGDTRSSKPDEAHNQISTQLIWSNLFAKYNMSFEWFNYLFECQYVQGFRFLSSRFMNKTSRLTSYNLQIGATDHHLHAQAPYSGHRRL